jgi:bacillithiol biosynthesis deacetylase BshB1
VSEQPLDVLAVGAHPDDADIGVGATLHKLARLGYRVGILDLTRGELASRGTVEERAGEAAEAAAALGAVCRENAALPDGAVMNEPAARQAVVRVVRTWRPRLLLAPMEVDRHPDHHHAHALVRDANYLAGLIRVETGQEPWRAPAVHYYRAYGERTQPSIIVDVADDFEAKLTALKAFRSQLHNPAYDGPATFVASEAYWRSLRDRAAALGALIGAAYGEALYTHGPVGLPVPPGLESQP